MHNTLGGALETCFVFLPFFTMAAFIIFSGKPKDM